MEHLSCCPICADSSLVLVTDRGLDFAGENVVQCVACGVVFLSPRMSEEEAAVYYASDTYSEAYRGAASPDAAALAQRDRTAAERAQQLAAWGVLEPGRTLLEVGCGAGNFLAECRKRGVEAAGIEPSVGYAERARGDGFKVAIGRFPDKHGPRETYSVLAFFHVVEHLHDPVRTLQAARARLAPGGMLVVEVPDLDRALGWRWSERYFHRPHLFDFSRSSLLFALWRAGFRPHAMTYSPRRPHHLLVCAVLEETSRQRPDAAASLRTLRRLRRWIVISRITRPTFLRLLYQRIARP